MFRQHSSNEHGIMAENVSIQINSIKIFSQIHLKCLELFFGLRYFCAYDLKKLLKSLSSIYNDLHRYNINKTRLVLEISAFLHPDIRINKFFTFSNG